MSAPKVELPKGGGAIRGIGEKFAANPVTGTGSMSVPLATSPGRSGFGPQLSLSYDSGSGNGPFGFGWSLSLPAITRKTDKGLPQYRDADESDVYVLSGAEDLVPVLRPDGTRFEDDTTAPGHVIHRYRPRIEGLFARIERWTSVATGEIHWRSITRDNVTTLYGRDNNSRIFDPTGPSAVPTRIFSWLICESYDDKGNAIVYEYAEENDDNVDRGQASERNRVRTANRYLKRIKYGNRVSRLIQPDLSTTSWMFEVVFDYDEGHYEEIDLDPTRPEAEQHRFVRASAAAGWPWAVRPDPFSSHRASFEVRTYRRCRRVLMLHHIPDLPTGEKGYDGLVRSTEFDYADLDYEQPVTLDDELAHQGSTRFASFIRAITQSGYVRDDTQTVVVRDSTEYATYLKKSLPPLEFEYSKATIQDSVLELDAESLENLPAGLDGATYQWVDLHGEGIPGVLTEQAHAWFYKRNLSPLPVRAHGPESVKARFAPLELVATKPNLGVIGEQAQFMDLGGDGHPDLVVLDGPMPGLYEHDGQESWQPFRSFTSLLNRDMRDPNLKFIDLDGDGHPDVLITEDDTFAWHASLAEEGFGPARRVAQSLDEEKGPRLVFADGTQSIYIADMSGDGLTDLVRIRIGEVCYWPNLGYGRFGAKVTMDNAPWLDSPEQFDQRRVRLADVDGSGTNDIIYLHRDGVRLYFNLSGNRLSEARRLTPFPRIENVSLVTVADVVGNGTACLVWSSPLPADAGRPLRYIDLMGGTKPHLLITSVNNLGAETQVHYAPSTQFYLAARHDGRPWVTRLPFPVQVVERVVTHDRISGNQFVTRYAYHHGYFDGIEREFRGFGMVEQWDTEEFAALRPGGQAPAGIDVDASSHVPPVLTRTWFHTGVYDGIDEISHQFSAEYYGAPDRSDPNYDAAFHSFYQTLLPDTILPPGLMPDEEREACRALKGSMLRQEVYALDSTDEEKHPFTVTEQNFTIRTLQERGANRHAVLLTHPRESISYHYERKPSDLRVGHALTLDVDEYGNVLKTAAIGYGRRQSDEDLSPTDRATQAKILITYTENAFTKDRDSGDHAIDRDNDYRTPLPSESRIYELTGLTMPAGSDRFTFEEVLEAGTAAGALDYEQDPIAGRLEKRMIEHMRTYYLRNDLAGPLPLGELQSLALPFESYKLAFTPRLVADVYGGMVNDAMLGDEGRYVHTEGDANWWIPSGRIFYSPNTADTSAEELAHARQHFFLPHRYRDPFHTNAVSTERFVAYDTYDLLVQETCDAVGNRVTVGERSIDPSQPPVRLRQDYRVLQPAMVMDPNRNRSEVAYDAIGMVVGTAVMGKPAPALVIGDSLDRFTSDLTQTEIDQFIANPRGPTAATFLHNATTRIVYDLTAYWREPDPAKKPPSIAATLARETHAREPVPAGGVRIQASLSYSDGFGREIQKKIQAEPGPVPQRDSNGKIIIGAGEQPHMTSNDVSPRWVGSGWTVFNNKGKPVRQYEPFFTDTHRFEFEVRIGVSAVLFWDPLERVVAILHPDHTWEKVVFDPWRQENWDVNDTVLATDPQADTDAGEFFSRLPAGDYLPTWHALRTDAAYAAALAARYPDPTDRANEKAAAEKARVHAATPTVGHADSLGRTFLTIAHNKFKYSDAPTPAPPVEEFHRTRIVLDIEGNQREVIDAKDRVVIRYDYDLLSNRIRQASMEAGEGWMLNDVAGKPLSAWDSRDHRFRTTYDPLRRPTDSFLRDGAGAEVVIGRSTYGETRPNPEASNLRGKVVELRDQAGVVTSDLYDFKGNLLRSKRRLALSYKTTLDWSGVVPLQDETYTSLTRYDALNRPTQVIPPHSDQLGTTINVIQPIYNDANLLEQLDAWLNRNAEPAGWLDPATANLHAITDIDYDAKGQRMTIDYGNGARTIYTYDPLSFRLVQLLTRRNALAFPDDCPPPPPGGRRGCHVQNLHYTYDPAGNITRIRDDAQQTVYFRNKSVEPSAEYTYDAVYRLIEATGREHLGQVAGAPIPHFYSDASSVGLRHPSDGNAMGRYLERYVYDTVGNLIEMQHRGTDPAHPGWTRVSALDEASSLESHKRSNRLTRTTIGGTSETYSADGDGYDAHGNMLRMPHLQVMQWDFDDRLQMTQRQAVNAADMDGTQHHGERTWYVYDSAGQRVRKITELSTGQSKDERIYLGGFELYRKNGANPLVRETLHIMDNRQRIALVETRIEGNEPGVPQQLTRYQFGNHLGSASLELDDHAHIISSEEHTPYGSTSYQAVRSQTEAPKRYGFTGKERDDANGLYYHGARYYAPWLGRWLAPDPSGIGAGFNLFDYSYDNPVRFQDNTGRDPTPDQLRFRQIFDDRRSADSSNAHARTLIQAFRDTQISGATARDRFVAILRLTGGTEHGPSRTFDPFTILQIGTESVQSGPKVGDTGFRKELRDSIPYHQDALNKDAKLHEPSSNQIGHFLTASSFGFSLTERENYISQERQRAAEYREQHPYLSIIRDLIDPTTDMAVQYAFEAEQYRRAMIGHEQIADRGFSGWGYTSTLLSPFMASPEDVQNFLRGRLDLIRIDETKNGNSYQDLLLTWVGYKFGQNIANGVFHTREDAARWLEMMLTEQDLNAVQSSDPFYADARQMQGMLEQFREIQMRIHPPRAAAR
ncbi:SpvB/TcaC N-terminal domain-containing protein [Nocardia gipuzkoensis]|uniref:SpvB/TcaC N-terminal domain-containing protein n=1 Tax=Nocardia gipuzkoensis TaxID=2749991 RepID=UPI00237D3D17|nr:SpvB/TcaC N-terminal domain-containing protein [Nocardia gipuzkoensis]MDE1674624.1 SpvB/TcaC N-terminal domain-containing protein [Nocardia gipuzkoensis]